MLFSPKGDYKNFRFRAELKINDNGNSGMYFRTAKKAGFTEGYEIQVNSTHADPIRTGLDLHVRPRLQAARPARHLVHPGDRGRGRELPRQDRHDVPDHGQRRAALRVPRPRPAWKEGHFAFQQHDPGSRVAIRKVEVMASPRRSERPGGNDPVWVRYCVPLRSIRRGTQ